MSGQVKKILQEDFKEKRKNKTFSNGRYVRNLYEKVKIEQANRVTLDSKEDINLIKKCDIKNVLGNEKPEEVQKVRIGFAI